MGARVERVARLYLDGYLGHVQERAVYQLRMHPELGADALAVCRAIREQDIQARALFQEIIAKCVALSPNFH